MTYIDFWTDLKDVRWLIYLIYKNKRLRDDYGIHITLRKFTLSVAEDVNRLSGKEISLYDEVKYITGVNLVTGLEGSVIDGKRKMFYNKMVNEPISIKDVFEYNSYLAVLDSNSIRSAYNTYINALYFIRNFSNGNNKLVSDFSEKLTEDFKNLVGMNLRIDDIYDICPVAIREMNKYGIYPEYADNTLYFDNCEITTDNCKKFYNMWENEKNIFWLLFLLFKCGSINEERIRQFTLDTLLKLISKTKSENLLVTFKDNLKMVQDSIFGIIRHDTLAATAKRDNVMPYNPFGRFWNYVNCSINSMKFDNVESSVSFAFFFILRAIQAMSVKDKTFFNRFTDEITSDFKKEFSNPFDNFQNVNLNFEGIKCLKSFDYVPKMKEDKWYFQPVNFC